MSVDTAETVRRSQAERRAATRSLLMSAAVDCLIEQGYARTTMVEVQQRAGVSRGALQHYWPSKASMVIAAVNQLFDEIIAVARTQAMRSIATGDRIDVSVDIIWSTYGTTLFAVSLDLWATARTDAELRGMLAPQEERLRQETLEMVRELFGPELASHPRFRQVTAVVLHSMRGAALAAGLRDAQASPKQLLAEWKKLLHTELDSPADAGITTEKR